MADVKNFSPIRMTASTEEAAVQQALQIVGAAREDVSVEIVSNDAKGVTVRVTPRRDDEAPAAAVAAPAPEPVVELPIVAEAPEAEEAEEEELPADDADEDDEDDLHDDEEDEEEDSDEDDSEDDDSEEDAEEVADEAPRPVFIPRPVDPEVQAQAVATAQEFLDRMGMNAQVQAVPSDETSDTDDTPRLLLNIDGDDVGILIGKHGQTLQAFQYLLNITLNNRRALEAGQTEEPRENTLRVVVDAGGYRSRRAGSLQQVARDAASRALRDRRPIRMEPMPAHERRLVHMALQNDKEITTTSEGREPMRYIVISPAGYRAPEGGERGGFARSYGGNRGGGRGYGGNRGGGGGNRSGGSGFGRREGR